MSIDLLRKLAFAALPALGLSACVSNADPTGPDNPIERQGSVQISVSTTGTNLDPDGYNLYIDEGRTAEVGINGSAVFTGLAARGWQVELRDYAFNCSVQGDNPKSFTIVAQATIDVAFSVTCS